MGDKTDGKIKSFFKKAFSYIITFFTGIAVFIFGKHLSDKRKRTERANINQQRAEDIKRRTEELNTRTESDTEKLRVGCDELSANCDRATELNNRFTDIINKIKSTEKEI